MAGKIHLVRHAEGLHNLRNDPNIQDAPLSERGFDFAEDLGRRFVQVQSNDVGAIISSPLRRTIQTSLATFTRILDSAHYPANCGKGVRNGVELVLNANLQEVTDLPCNTGSPITDLEQEFPELAPQIRALNPDWYVKTEPNSPLPPVAQRRVEILDQLNQKLSALSNSTKGKDIVVVTHQGVIALLAPAANIPLAQWQTFKLIKNAAGQLELQ